MRALGFGVAVATAMFLLPVNAQRIEVGPGGFGIGGGERYYGANGVMGANGAMGGAVLNCGTLASTKASSANKVKVIAAVTA